MHETVCIVDNHVQEYTRIDVDVIHSFIRIKCNYGSIGALIAAVVVVSEMNGTKKQHSTLGVSSQERRHQKGNVVDVTAGLLEKIRLLFCRKDGMVAVGKQEEGKARQVAEKRVDVMVGLKQSLVLCMEEVEGQGFEQGQVEDSVRFVVDMLGRDVEKRRYVLYERGVVKRNVASLAQIVTMLVMNDLLSRLSRDDLPVYYANMSKSLDQARVTYVVDTVGDDVVLTGLDSEEEKETRKNHTQQQQQEEEEEEEEEDRQRQKQQEEEKMKEEKMKEEKERMKAWVLQNAYSESEEEDGMYDEDTDGDDDGGSIEDWEVWGSPGEIERKRAEKARSMMSREDTIALIAHDMRHAMNDAAVAKAKKDKNGQKEAGAIIGRLKKDMQQLGICDEDLEAYSNDIEKDRTVGVEETSAYKEEHTAACSSERPSLSSGEDAPEAAFDLFGDDAPDHTEPTKIRNFAYASIILNKTLRESVRGTMRGTQKKQVKAPLKKHPKAILQQLVNKQGWGAPRFQKLSKDDDIYRFQVLVDVKQSKGKKSLRSGIHKFAVPAELDGWDTIQKAQDACATKALMDLYGNTNEVEWELLSEPFDALVLDIAEHQGQEACHSETASHAREEFLDSLLNSVYLGDEGYEKETLNESRKSTLRHKALETISAKVAELASTHMEQQSKILERNFIQWKSSDDGSYWMQKRYSLPVSQIRESLLKALEIHDVVLVSGETGSGKTTQVPQIVLDECIESLKGAACRIVCTQPRQIAAISVADRVCEERCEEGPGRKGSLVGYSVRFDSATNAGTRLEFCTTGILLRRLSSDPFLAKFSHIIVDEVHERTMQSDFLIAMLRDLVDVRRQAGLPLKVIFMSATMNTQMVSDYFFGCPILNASGRTYPVEHMFLEDVYEISNYVLDMDSPAALKAKGLRGGQKKLENSSGSKHKALIQGNWGDDIADVVLNQYFDESLYEAYRYVLDIQCTGPRWTSFTCMFFMQPPNYKESFPCE